MGRKLIIVSLWIALCASLGYFLPKMPIFKKLVEIKVVEVVGTDKIKKEDLVNVFSHQNWFFVDEEDIKNKLLKKYKNLKDIDIKRLFIGKINLYVIERQPVAILYYKNNKYFIDKDGVILEGKFKNKNLTEIYIYSQSNKLNQEMIDEILSLNATLTKHFKIKKIILKNEQISFTTIDDKILAFNVKNIYSQIEKMKKFIKSTDINLYKYLDFSFESMVIARR